MQLFYTPKIRQVFLIGGVIGSILGILLRVFLPAFSHQELSLHISIRNLLGYPASFYSYLTLFLLSCLYQCFYFFLGGMVGLLISKLYFGKRGYTLFVTRTFWRLSGIMFFILLFLYVRVDLANPYQNVASDVFRTIPTSKELGRTIKNLFLPNIVSPTNISYTQPSQQTMTTYQPQNTSSNYQPPQVQPQSNPVAQPAVQAPVVHTASPQELVAAVNTYRQRNGRSPLASDGDITNYANIVANAFAQQGALVRSATFAQQTESARATLTSKYNIGDISLMGVTGTGQYVVETYMASNSSYNVRLLGTNWTHIGVGVRGSIMTFVFASPADSVHVPLNKN